MRTHAVLVSMIAAVLMIGPLARAQDSRIQDANLRCSAFMDVLDEGLQMAFVHGFMQGVSIGRARAIAVLNATLGESSRPVPELAVVKSFLEQDFEPAKGKTYGQLRFAVLSACSAKDAANRYVASVLSDIVHGRR